MYLKLLFQTFNNKIHKQCKSWSKMQNKKWQPIKLGKQSLSNDPLNEYYLFFSVLKLPMGTLQFSFSIHNYFNYLF